MANVHLLPSFLILLLLIPFPQITSFVPSRVNTQFSCHSILIYDPRSIHRYKNQQHQAVDNFVLYAKKKKNKKKGRVTYKSKDFLENLENKIQQSNENVVLIVDSNNVRGVDNFQLSNADLIKSLASWRRSLQMKLRSIICVIDHGCTSDCFTYDGITVVFAGPNRTADDVIANDCQWFTSSLSSKNHCDSDNNDVVAGGLNNNSEEIFIDNNNKNKKRRKIHIWVVTNDRELRSRCRRTNNWQSQIFNSNIQYTDDTVKVFSSMHLAELLKNHWNDQVMVTTNIDSKLEGNDDNNIIHDDDDDDDDDDWRLKILNELTMVENNIRAYEIPSFHNNRIKGKLQRRKSYGRKSIVSEMIVSSKEELLSVNSDDSYNALRHPLGKEEFNERTWHRVLIAEQLRNILCIRLKEKGGDYDVEEEEEEGRQCKENDDEDSKELEEDMEIEKDEIANILSCYHDRHRKSRMSPVNLLYDQRIRNDERAKKSLLKYLKEHSDELSSSPMSSLLSSGGEGVVGEEEEETDKPKHQQIEKEQYHHETFGETRVSFMKRILTSGPMGQRSNSGRSGGSHGGGADLRTQHEIITEYTETAPEHLQFRKTRDVRDLLKKVAIKEKRPPDYIPRWHLLNNNKEDK